MIERIERVIDWTLKALTTLLLGALTLLVSYTVVLRFVFRTGFPAGEELCRYLFVWAAFLGVILGVRADAHMSIGFLGEKVPGLRPLLGVVYYLFHYLFFAIVAYYGTLFAAQAATARSTLLPITMNYVYAAVPACGYSCLVIVTLRLLRELRGAVGRRDRGDLT